MGRKQRVDGDAEAKCRVLVTTQIGDEVIPGNTLFVGTADEVAYLVASGAGDDNPDAIAYAESQQTE